MGTPSGMYTHPAALRWPCLSPSLFKDCSEMLNHVTGYSQSYIEEGDSCRSMPSCSDLTLEQADQLPQSSTILQTPTDDQIHVHVPSTQLSMAPETWSLGLETLMRSMCWQETRRCQCKVPCMVQPMQKPR